MAAPFGQEPGPGRGAGGDALVLWAERTGLRGGGVPGRGGLRFAFYGRVQAEDWQDPVTSRARQRHQADVLVAGHGKIVAGFFDSGASRTLPWARRPQAAALVAALADPDRGWDAIVIGEYERAFYGNQYASMAPLFEPTGSRCGCRRWAAVSIGTPRITSRRCSRWACRRSGRLPGPGSGSVPRWPRRPWSRAGTWVAGRRTGTGSRMRGRTRTKRTPRGAGGRTASSRTR